MENSFFLGFMIGALFCVLIYVLGYLLSTRR
jgi:hypothetical protein